MLFWIFLMREALLFSSWSTIIFLIVSKDIQKYDQRKFYFFQKRNIFKFGIHVHRWKKNCKKNLQFFFHTPKLQNKNFAISKISQNTLFRKHQIQKKYFCEKKNFRQKKFDKIISNKKKL